MSFNKWYIGTLLFVVLCGNTMSSSAQSNQALNAFIKKNGLAYASVGVRVVEIESGKTIGSHNENMALCPASALKALTTATALELFGPDYQYTTTILYEGTINAQGNLTGNLIIKGTGDPSLGSSYLQTDPHPFLHKHPEAFLSDWLAAIQKAGIKSISGNILVIDNLFGYEGVSKRWVWEDLGNYYASGTYGVSIFDNSYRLYFKSGAVGTTPTVLRTEPEIPGLTFENHLKAANNSADSAYIYGVPFSFDRKIYGTIPALRSSFSIKGDVPDPGLLLAQTLYNHLQNNGIQISGGAYTSRTQPQPKTTEKQHEIYAHKGSRLKEIIKVTNFRSNNHYAEHLFYKTGWDKSQACTSEYIPSLAAQKIARYWAQKGINTKGLFQYDGSGLANANAISAKTLTDVLIYMQKNSKHANDFYLSLPLAGKEGTVRSFLKGSALDGKARIKSGSIAKVQAYAGYYEKGGKRYAFSVFVNNFTGSRAVLRTQIEQLLLGL